MINDIESDKQGPPKNAKDRWDKWHVVSNSIAVLLVPLLVGYFGYEINSAVKDKEISQKYVELSIGILKGDPDKESPALREWALNVINSNSPVKLDPKVREELRHKPLRPVRVVTPKAVENSQHAASTKVITDEKGNFLTDENGNVLVTEGEGLRAGTARAGDHL